MTYQRPAYEEVALVHGDSTVRLRPSLRAAATLEARYGFPALYRALDELNLTIISEIILAASVYRQDAAAFLADIRGRPLFALYGEICQPLAELVYMFTPAPAQRLDNVAKHGGKPLPWANYYASLFDHATGWLGWTPETAWSATPSEIDRAYSALVAKLKAIRGSGEEDKQSEKQVDLEQAARNEAAGLDPEFNRAGLQSLKSKLVGAR